MSKSVFYLCRVWLPDFAESSDKMLFSSFEAAKSFLFERLLWYCKDELQTNENHPNTWLLPGRCIYSIEEIKMVA